MKVRTWMGWVKIGEAVGQEWRGKERQEKLDGSRKFGVGEGATGIEPETALKQGAQRHQTTQDVRQGTHVIMR
jgi:hypothetical protein